MNPLCSRLPTPAMSYDFRKRELFQFFLSLKKSHCLNFSFVKNSRIFFARASEKAYGYTIFKTKHQCPILQNYLRKRNLFPARGNISVSIPTLALRTDSDKFSFITRASVYGTPESENATVFVAKTGVIVPGVPCVDRGNWGRRRYIARSGQNSVFWEESFGKYLALLVHLAYRDTDLFSERVGPRVIILKDSQVSSCLKRTREITN